MTSRVGIFVLLLPPEIHKEGIEEREREEKKERSWKLEWKRDGSESEEERICSVSFRKLAR